MSLPGVTIDRALTDPDLLGAALGPAATWQTWLIVLRAAFGQELTESELIEFAQVAGSRKPPAQRVRELWAVAGRRSGKSRIAAAVLVFIACFIDHSTKLAPGEKGFVLCLSATKDQAALIQGYCLGFLEASPVLAGQIAGTTDEEITLHNGVVIGVHTNSFRTVRGRTILAAVFDEAAFWRDESSATPDVEVYRAVLPSLVASGGMLVGISSPYRKIGLLHAKHAKHFGVDSDDVLVIKAASSVLNPTIDQGLIESARADDAEAASSEWDAEFRADLSALLADDVIDRAIDPNRPLEIPPMRGVRYVAFVDASAGRHDRYCIAIGHMQGERFIADCVRGATPPLDVREVTREYVNLLRVYGLSSVTGDNYAGDWVRGEFEQHQVRYEASKLPKSGLYLEGLSRWNQGNVSIPDIATLTRELRLLERRTSRTGRDSVDHPQRGSDDYANVVFGAQYIASDGGQVGEFSVGGVRMGYADPSESPQQRMQGGRFTIVTSEWARDRDRRFENNNADHMARGRHAPNAEFGVKDPNKLAKLVEQMKARQAREAAQERGP